MSFKCISVDAARELIERNNAQVIDIRDMRSYEAGHIANAERIDNSNVEGFIQRADTARPLIVCCYHGNTSKGAAEYFASKGFAEAYSLDGGYAAWRLVSRE
ncbi:MAG: thiosulfate sulfurtransferase [Gammaproteobacteria bacterium]|nr:MAG: thiosulfate sulfurtransferase [Gammaproteobacteria bacterium]TND01436.1 MAG: thiosulfate sulfurtransferase [Gammaproteobacteria bacterium]